MLPIHTSPTRHSSSSWREKLVSPPNRSLSRFRKRPFILILLALTLITLFNLHTLGTWRRDLVYLLRPIWDTPEKPWTIITHYPAPYMSTVGKSGDSTGQEGEIDVAHWCGLHGWTARGLEQESSSGPVVVDAILLSTELDMLEIRIKEYLGQVDYFLIVESDKTFAGTDKPPHFEINRARFDAIVNGYKGSRKPRIVYHKVQGLLSGRKVGSFENEYTMRTQVSKQLSSLDLPAGSLVIQSDVDEIVSRDTIRLLSSCKGYPSTLHLNVRNYRYGFNFPILDNGYWRPHVLTTSSRNEQIAYHHARGGDVLLADAGWHCTFCFKTLGEMKAKMEGYSHNDRVRSKKLLKMDVLREKACNGEDPFDMYPVSSYQIGYRPHGRSHASHRDSTRHGLDLSMKHADSGYRKHSPTKTLSRNPVAPHHHIPSSTYLWP